ncbi:hypothetical protein [Chitinophaga sp. Cy-1792]|uniref:hypothetical protein n=1 Tax=Chitinophaga sp. Cy-1792 TaxID=2608339 RepID=UPI001420DAF5|nr:hypothetical protein [Chitinophaga sp. Cy-1792]NIG56189.1 hypothetical protein [Chitinophaga sp. Cy-1792]
MPSTSLSTRKWALLEILLIIGFALIPLFMTFPYRVNIFLSWEGAYRLYLGQQPYKDFGMPLGYGYWIVPALFFKLFGPAMITLVKAQAFLNILAGLSFISILKSFDVKPGIRITALLVFLLSYSLNNFWPWYNHTVIVYELVGLSFLLRGLFTDNKIAGWLMMIIAAFFLFLSFFTKQDGGGMALLIALALLLYNAVTSSRWSALVAFIIAYLSVALLIILPLGAGFSYWFNHGQAPHSSRLDPGDIFTEIMAWSAWLKAYFLLVVFSIAAGVSSWKAWLQDRKAVTFALLTLGILAEAAIFQVTSYTPLDNNIFFHAFCFAFIGHQLCNKLSFNTESRKFIGMTAALVLLWWSGAYWRYADRLTQRIFPQHDIAAEMKATGENIVSRHNYMVIKPDTSFVDEPVGQWTFTNLPVFKRIYMPVSTVKGIERVLALPVVKEKKSGLKVLNMTELTPLAEAMPYQLETGPDYPLWYHLGVGMFNRQLHTFEEKIKAHHYDLILYEYAPTLNNFYPFALRPVLQDNYMRIDTFLAPRRPTNATIEIYVNTSK